MVNLSYCILSVCANLRKVNGLCIILDISMNAYFLVLCIECFESN